MRKAERVSRLVKAEPIELRVAPSPLRPSPRQARGPLGRRGVVAPENFLRRASSVRRALSPACRDQSLRRGQQLSFQFRSGVADSMLSR